MPKPKSVKPIHRMNIGVPVDVYEALQGYSEFVGKTPSTVASDFIKDMQPTMLAIAKAMQKAKRNKEKGIEEMRQIVLQEIAKTAQLASLGQADLLDDKKEES